MKLVIIDRDGTLNPVAEDFVTSADEWTALPGALEAIARLNHAGQPGLGRGLFDVMALNGIQAKLNRQLAAVGGRVDAVFYCPHAADENCTCRKPAPGLLEQICERFGAERQDVQVVGSCADHVQAGAALGARLHLVCTGQSAHVAPSQPLPPGLPLGTRLHASLNDFVDHLLPVVQVSTASTAPLVIATPNEPPLPVLLHGASHPIAT